MLIEIKELSWFSFLVLSTSDFFRGALLRVPKAVFSDKFQCDNIYSSFFVVVVVSLFKLYRKCEIFMLLRTNKTINFLVMLLCFNRRKCFSQDFRLPYEIRKGQYKQGPERGVFFLNGHYAFNIYFQLSENFSSSQTKEK